MWTPEYYIRYLPFDMSVGGATVPNDDGSFEIYLNSRMSEDQQQQWLDHELAHIVDDHFYKDIPVGVAEAQADGIELPDPPPPRKCKVIPVFDSPEELAKWILSYN